MPRKGVAQQCVTGHSAFIFDRGGTKRMFPLLNMSYIQWARERDSTSEATVRIIGKACNDQMANLESARSHRHELVIFRGQERVWEGPLHRTQTQTGFAEFVAHDVTEYIFNQPLTQTWNNQYPNVTTVTQRIGDIIAYEMTHGRTMKFFDGTNWVDYPMLAWEDPATPPANVVPFLQVHHFPNEARYSGKTLPFDMTVGDHLASLARSQGIDFTAMGRAIHIWDTSRSLGRLQTLTEADFYADVLVSEYGADHTQAAYVVAQEGIYGQSVNPDNLDYYGPWTKMFTVYNDDGTDQPTQSELNSQAQRNTSGRSPAPIEVRVPDNSGIILSDTLTINKLVAGVQVPLRATLGARKISQLQKLDSVTVTEDENGETVQVTLTPATRPDDDTEA